MTIESRTMWLSSGTGTHRQSVTRLAPLIPFVVATLTGANY
jgi:hypothetical protein